MAAAAVRNELVSIALYRSSSIIFPLVFFFKYGEQEWSGLAARERRVSGRTTRRVAVVAISLHPLG